MNTNKTLRVGTVPYTNAFPLVWHLNEFIPNAVITSAVPSELAPQLEKGEIDVALLSSYELLNHPEYGFIPGIGICSYGPVRSVGLFAKTFISDCQQIALDLSSVTSTVLLRILLKHYWKINPSMLNYTPPVENGLKIADTALSIGDSSLVKLEKDYLFYDLGQIWTEWTGLPFVFALWITREEINPNDLEPAFTAAKDKGLQNIKAIASETAQNAEHSSEFYLDYFTRYIKYDMDEAELKGMELFFEYARKIESQE